MPGTSQHLVQDRLNCEAMPHSRTSRRPNFFGSPTETSNLDLQFIVLVSPTCDTLMRTSTLMDVAEGAAQAGVHWTGGGDVGGSGPDFDGAVPAAVRTSFLAGQLGDDADLAIGTLMFHFLSRYAAFRAA